MRLLIDGRRLGPRRTGVGRYLETLLGGWAGAGPPVAPTVVILHDHAGAATVPAGVPGLSAEVAAAGWPGLLWERWGLGRALRPGDVLFAPTNLAPPSWRGPTVVVTFDALLWAAPSYFTLSDRIRFKGRIRNAATRADLVVVPSEATARDLVRFLGVDPGRVRVVYPAPDPAFRPLAADDPAIASARRRSGLDDSSYLLFVGKPSRRRHLAEVLDAFEIHRRGHPRAILALAGPGTESGPWSGRPGVRALGHVAEATLPALMAGADALLYPSSYEGFGLPVIEALAAGCPVVTLRNSALVESGGDAAVFAESASAADLARALETLEDDRPGRVARGLRHAAGFSLETFTRGIDDAIREVAGGTGHRGSAGRVGT